MEYYFITGTSKGIGKALTEAILQNDNTYVYGISRNCAVKHARYHHLHFDLSDTTALRNNLHKVFVPLKEAERIVLVNNAGVLGKIDYIGSQATDNFEFVFDVNVIGPAILMNTFLSAYYSQQCPKIILNISSGAGKRPMDGWSAYCASKAALDMLSLTCQKEQELLGTGVKVYSLAPGVVDTAMQAHIREAESDQFSELERFKLLKENKELLDPEAVGKKILQLLKQPQQYSSVLMRVDEI
ncbi:SDR family NAD(P)-dependent oxidoreductase [Adhaeribacter rhizoryzae]|uniref:SDR family NAD(P)-dependent oxidoreductase n=1 Tax=Adhaeribacter rhizoryzae TaxID=2607907 RepID=A0A5M6DT32_9BACT|nr:SDR family NAD(P)-dependent oxidoreductase [Adhaeribacter rhizoryzae]KAA5548565.1 SDR family NAD(P)-dependent oxidoreductase [Adhaeribacter rhizoryzae]